MDGHLAQEMDAGRKMQNVAAVYNNTNQLFKMCNDIKITVKIRMLKERHTRCLLKVDKTIKRSVDISVTTQLHNPHVTWLFNGRK